MEMTQQFDEINIMKHIPNNSKNSQIKIIKLKMKSHAIAIAIAIAIAVFEGFQKTSKYRDLLAGTKKENSFEIETSKLSKASTIIQPFKL